MTRAATIEIRRRRPSRGRPRRAAWRPLLLLSLLVTTSTVEAQTRGPTPSRRPDVAALEAARRFLCPHGGTPMPGRRGRCRGGGGTTGASGDHPSVRGWDTGLAPATGGQAPCPEGTAPVASLARGDATRCLPR